MAMSMEAATWHASTTETTMPLCSTSLKQPTYEALYLPGATAKRRIPEMLMMLRKPRARNSWAK